MKLKQDDLMALYGGFCRSEAQKYAGWADADDLYSAAILGLFEAYARADHDMLDKLSADEGRAVFLGLAAPTCVMKCVRRLRCQVMHCRGLHGPCLTWRCLNV